MTFGTTMPCRRVAMRSQRGNRFARAYLIMASALLANLLTAAAPAASDTLSQVRERGYLRCGVSDSPGLAERTLQGRWVGFQVEQCRAIAAAVLEDAEAIEVVPTAAVGRFAILQHGRVDVALSNITWTLGREAGLGLAFTVVTFYDGQGFLVRRNGGITRLADAYGKTVCAIDGTTTEQNVRDVDRRLQAGFDIVTFHIGASLWNAFLGRQCDVITSDTSDFVRHAAERIADPGTVTVLPEMISREPMAPMVRADDRRWLLIVRWVLYALIIAEEKGVTAASAAGDGAADGDSETLRLLGRQPGSGGDLGLDDRWAARAIAAVGHYGELYSRTLGRQSRFKLPRGLNRLWRDGGLLYAPALR